MSSLLIVYGSETGTAQDTAEMLSREAKSRKLAARVVGFDEVDVDELHREPAILFVVSTTGQGEMPPNMRSSWQKLLRKSLAVHWKNSDVHTAVLALGDSSYLKYNFAGKKLYRRLINLGAQMLAPLGLADDQHEIGIDGALIPWKNDVWSAIFELNKFPEMLPEPDKNISIPPKYEIVRVEREESAVGVSSCRQDYFELDVEFNKRVTSEDHFQDTRLVRFRANQQLSDRFRYEAGDVLMVRPYNNDETMEIAIDALGYSDDVLDQPIRLRQNDEFTALPPAWLIGEKTTLRTCLRRYLDLQQIPRRSFFEVLATISTDEMETERLAELGSPQGLDDLLNYCTRCKRTTAETLRDFPNTAKHIKPERLFDLLSPIRPRAFSIASSPTMEADVVELLVAKVEYKSRMAERRRGLCSTFISRLQPGDKVFAKVRPGTFKFPSTDSTPVICIGPGTGVAPFRSFLHYRHRRSGQETPNALMFFGCRGSKNDFYFGGEWPTITSVRLITAFSRDTDKKIYVQDKIDEFAEQVWDVLNQGGSVFVAGSSGDMPKAVNESLNAVALRFGGVENWVASAESKGRIQYETWS